MNILLVTQNEELYLYDALKYWFELMDEKDSVVACVLLNPAASGAGRGVSLITRARNALSVFGFAFFINVAVRFVVRSVFKRQSVQRLLHTLQVPIIRLTGSINDADSLALLRDTSPDIIVSIQGNEIFKQDFLQIAPCLNLHTAPLPLYRGLMPTFWALHNRELKTAVSVFLVDEGIDSGDIYIQYPVPANGASLDSLIRTTKAMGMIAIHDAIDCVRRGEQPRIRNEETESTYYGFPARSDVKQFKKNGASLF